MVSLSSWQKGKGKGRFMGLFNTAAVRLLYSYPQQVPAFISRGATHHRDARDLYQRRRELLPMNFASKSVIHENSLGSFTCRKAGTWDILFYFPSEGRHTEDFPDPRKIHGFGRVWTRELGFQWPVCSLSWPKLKNQSKTEDDMKLQSNTKSYDQGQFMTKAQLSVQDQGLREVLVQEQALHCFNPRSYGTSTDKSSYGLH